MASTPRREVRAFTISSGNPARVTGVNVIGLSRRGVDDATIEALGPCSRARGSSQPVGSSTGCPAISLRW
jgi:UDP-N-acetylglucosamine acyltransferase